LAEKIAKVVKTFCLRETQVVNFSLADDPTIQQPGFDLLRQQRSLLNRFWAAQGHCGACEKKWNQAATDVCSCGEKQTMSHTVDSCPPSKLNGGLSQLHSAEDEAVVRLISCGSQCACRKKNWPSALRGTVRWVSVLHRLMAE